jgi:hypothetical protein
MWAGDGACGGRAGGYRGGAEVARVTVITIILAIASAITGLVAAFYVWRSTCVPVAPEGFEPVDLDLKSLAWMSATIDATREAGRLNRIAIGWTVASINFAAISAIIGALPILN